MADCRAESERWSRCWVYELSEVHGTFGALLWRTRHRTWQRIRKREMPQGWRFVDKGGGIVFIKGVAVRKRRRHTIRVSADVVVGASNARKGAKLPETFELIVDRKARGMA